MVRAVLFWGGSWRRCIHSEGCHQKCNLFFLAISMIRRLISQLLTFFTIIMSCVMLTGCMPEYFYWERTDGQLWDEKHFDNAKARCGIKSEKVSTFVMNQSRLDYTYNTEYCSCMLLEGYEDIGNDEQTPLCKVYLP